MSIGITLLTCTGNRPEAFKLCEKYISDQDCAQWIVVDDGELPTKITGTQEYVRGPAVWQKGMNTQLQNLREGIKHAKGEYIFIIEDDDFYKPDYISVMRCALRHAPLVGECGVTYYNVQHRCWKEMKNYQHASLCQTAFHRSLIPEFIEALDTGDRFVDLAFWGIVKRKRIDHLLLHGLNLCVGIKGMPGRPGIGVGHYPVGYTPDPSLKKFKELVGDAVENYFPATSLSSPQYGGSTECKRRPFDSPPS